ncbi:MAG: DUF4363 family protein [Limnochordia bacterium]|jgi:hypothetical protein
MRTVGVLGLLVLLFIGVALWAQHDLIRAGEQLEADVQAVTTAVQHEDWPSVRQHAETLWKRWQRIERRWNLLTEHPEIDDINDVLSRLRGYAEAEEPAALLAEARAAHHLFTHVPRKEAFRLSNIL